MVEMGVVGGVVVDVRCGGGDVSTVEVLWVWWRWGILVVRRCMCIAVVVLWVQ